VEVVSLEAEPLALLEHDLGHAAVRQRPAVRAGQNEEPPAWRPRERGLELGRAGDEERLASLALAEVEHLAVIVRPHEPGPVVRALHRAYADFEDKAGQGSCLGAELLNGPVWPGDVLLLLLLRGGEPAHALGGILGEPALVDGMLEEDAHDLGDVVGEADAVGIGLLRGDHVLADRVRGVPLAGFLLDVEEDLLVVGAGAGLEPRPAVGLAVGINEGPPGGGRLVCFAAEDFPVDPVEVGCVWLEPDAPGVPERPCLALYSDAPMTVPVLPEILLHHLTPSSPSTA
jgi:hypothetical protein